MNQIPNSKENRFRSFEIWDWNLFGICDFGFLTLQSALYTMQVKGGTHGKVRSDY
jgi:hypothetical protein